MRCDGGSRVSYRCTEHTAAALQLLGRCGRLLAQAQFAEDFGGDLRHRRRRIAVLPGWGGTPLSHGGRMRRGERGTEDSDRSQAS